jgi:hypothetical protein
VSKIGWKFKKRKVRWKLSFLGKYKRNKEDNNNKQNQKKKQVRVYHTCNKMVGNKDGGRRFDEEKELKNGR